MKDLNRALRPTAWENVIGQSDIKEICQKALAENKFPKFSIFYGPTGVGKSCIAELVARQIVGEKGTLAESKSIMKFNMAALLGKSDIISIIDNIFKFKALTETAVYILEEVQVLRQKEEQSPFLEELTKIPDNVYVIMCTTKISALSLELRNRAILFQLGLPSYEECSDFVDSVLYQLGLCSMPVKAKEVLIKSSDYTPRSILKHIELLASSDMVSEEDVYKFFHVVSNMGHIQLLRALADNTVGLYEFSCIVKGILDKGHAQSLFFSFRDFLIQALLEKATQEEELALTNDEREALNKLSDVLNETTFVKLFEALSRADSFKHDTAKDVLAAFIKVKLTMTNSGVTAVISQNAQSAATSVITSRKNSRQTSIAKPIQEVITNVTSGTSLSSFGITDEVIYHED